MEKLEERLYSGEGIDCSAAEWQECSKRSLRHYTQQGLTTVAGGAHRISEYLLKPEVRAIR
jgi:hypothetical protein